MASFFQQMIGVWTLLYGVMGFLFYLFVIIPRQLLLKQAVGLPFKSIDANHIVGILFSYLILYFILGLSGVLLLRNRVKKALFVFIPSMMTLLVLNDLLEGAINDYSWIAFILICGLFVKLKF